MPSIHTTMSQGIAKYSQNVTQGDAEAFAITARATAEAEGMNMKAEAFREYKKAAKVITHSNLPYVMTRIYNLGKKSKKSSRHIFQVALWMDALPSMAAEVSAPLSQCDKV